MRRLISVCVFILLLATVASAQSANDQARTKDAITKGEFAQLVINIVLRYEQGAVLDPVASLDRLKGWRLAPTTWEADSPLIHRELAMILGHVGIEYLPAKPEAPVSGIFVEALLWREIGKLRDYNANRLGHGFSSNHVLDAGIDRAVSPSDFD